MSYDGIILDNVKNELENLISNARIEKVYQPEADELTILLRSTSNNYKLLLSANSKYPRVHLTSSNKNNPDNAPLFCMMLRKHLSGGKIIKFNQPEFERILEIYIEVLDEYRDLVVKKLVIEIMGKHSNIILTDENDVIIDSIKHIPETVSSIRTVLPKIPYVYPPSQNKLNPTKVTSEMFINFIKIADNSLTVAKFLTSSFTGLSPLVIEEICYLAKVESTSVLQVLSHSQIEALCHSFFAIVSFVKVKNYSNFIFYDTKRNPIDFYSVPLSSKSDYNIIHFESASVMLDKYYSEKDNSDRLKQRYSDIKKLIENHLDRAQKKKILQLKSLDDTKGADAYKLKGDLVLSYIYMIKKGMTEIDVQNFYSENSENVKLVLDKDLTPSENAQRFFSRYNKMKRTETAVTQQLEEVNSEIIYLESLLTSLESVESEADISEIKEELYEGKYIRRPRDKSKKKNAKSDPLHYVSSDGFNIYVGKNNYQNDYLTMKFAKPNDMWFHTKDIPGSHVLVVCENKEIPDTTLYEAAMLAAYNSKAKQGSNIPVDYTEKRNVKKPNGSKPGFVIYLTNKTKFVTPDESEIEKIVKK